MKTQSSFLIYLLQNNIRYPVLAKKQPSPEGGARPPPLGGYRHALPLPPRGRGRSAKRGRGRGAALQSITSE